VLAGTDGETQTGFGFSLGREPSQLSVAAVADEAAQRATRMLGARKPPSGRMAVVLDPWVTAQVLGIVGDTLLGDVVLKGRSPFAGRIGEAIASPLVTLVDDPTCPEAFTATPLDGEGLATRPNRLVAGGRLERYLYDTTTARRAGTTSTGSAVRRGFTSTPGVGAVALRVEPGPHDPAALLALVGDGILVQDVSGLHSGVNPVSGDLSTGAEGLRIRGGEVAEPLREFTLATTLQRLLVDIRAVGSDLQWLPMSAAGVSLVVGDVTVSGT
jgi:PmbA protein